MAVAPIIVAGVCGYSRKIVKTLADFAVYALRQFGRAVREYDTVIQQVRRRREKSHRGARLRGQAPRTPTRRIAQHNDTGRRRRKKSSP
jgi:hypothetical protein